jgi:hypothetical protein
MNLSPRTVNLLKTYSVLSAKKPVFQSSGMKKSLKGKQGWQPCKKSVTPSKTGVQMFCNDLKIPDPGFHRDDSRKHFPTFSLAHQDCNLLRSVDCTNAMPPSDFVFFYRG